MSIPSQGSVARVGLGTKIFWALVILGFGAATFGALKTYLDNRSELSALEERGVEEDATVTSVTEISGRRIETYHKINVSFHPQGLGDSASAEILDCSGHRYERGLDVVRILYLPEDPQVIRLAACRSSFDANLLPGIIGVVFAAFTLFILWATRRVWTINSTP
ncbi:MAG: DUF3592 domain-containing protein [Actinomycetota bacterium]